MITAGGRTRAEAWLDAVLKMDPKVDGGRLYNLVVEIQQPAAVTARSREIERLVDEALRRSGQQPIITVAETIFPMTEYKKGGLEQVYKYPKTIFPRIKSAPGNSKGTYALRLVERRCTDGEPFNPLKTMVEKLRKNIARTSTQRAFYELDATLETSELKFYEAEVDKNNPIGGQCLSHLSFKLGPGKKDLYLTALYRSQYFIEKALGNFRGLAGLQLAVAKELNLQVGPLVVHATYAQLDAPAAGGDKGLKALLEACQATAKMERTHEPA